MEVWAAAGCQNLQVEEEVPVAGRCCRHALDTPVGGAICCSYTQESQEIAVDVDDRGCRWRFGRVAV